MTIPVLFSTNLRFSSNDNQNIQNIGDDMILIQPLFVVTQESNVRHAQVDRFRPVARQLPAQNVKEKRVKQPKKEWKRSLKSFT